MKTGPVRGARMRKPPVEPRPLDRPLRGARHADLLGRFERALAQQDGAAGAHCVHELWMRGEIGLNVEKLLEQLWARAAASIPDWLPMRYVDWLPAAYDVAARFHASRRGRYNVYLVLLDYGDSRPDPHGVYVGMTHYTPAQRFDQHKAGIRAAGAVLRRGLELLAGPTLHLQRMARTEAVRIEEQLAEALRAAGLFVQGGH
ncbi:MAG TPA: hypothetical protein VF055_07550 [Steroidobacteraceae bacterium]